MAGRNHVKAVWLLVAGGILGLLVPASVLAASYSVTSLNGSYGFSGAKAGIITEGQIYLDCSLNGTVGGSYLSGNAMCTQVPAPGGTLTNNSATHGDYTGVMTFDGNGALTISGTMSENGVVSSLSGSGTYTVNADGTGTLSVSTFSASFVIVSGGNEVLFSRTTNGKGPQLGVAIKQ